MSDTKISTVRKYDLRTLQTRPPGNPWRWTEEGGQVGPKKTGRGLTVVRREGPWGRRIGGPVLAGDEEPSSGGFGVRLGSVGDVGRQVVVTYRSTSVVLLEGLPVGMVAPPVTRAPTSTGPTTPSPALSSGPSEGGPQGYRGLPTETRPGRRLGGPSGSPRPSSDEPE